jgi:hypothetical protein
MHHTVAKRGLCEHVRILCERYVAVKSHPLFIKKSSNANIICCESSVHFVLGSKHDSMFSQIDVHVNSLVDMLRSPVTSHK